jgi:hypothetical protein
MTQFLTPPPVEEEAAVEPPRPPRKAETTSISFVPLIKRLVSPEEIDDDARNELVEQIRAAASQIGFYQAASQIEEMLPGLKFKAGKETRLRVYRAYDLAAQFILIHIGKEIDSAQVEGKHLGPNLIGGYCSEAFDCMLAGQDVRSGVESLVSVVESLLLRAVLNPRVSENFCTLASRAIEVICGRTQASLEKDEQGFRSALRKHKKLDTPAPIKRNRSRSINVGFLEYLRDLETKVLTLSKGALTQKEIIEPTMESLYLQLQSINKAGFLPLAAALKVRIGFSILTADQAKAHEFLGSAAKDFEAQGDRELEFKLPRLSQNRYHQAHKMYSQKGDAAGAQRVGSNLLKAGE